MRLEKGMSLTQKRSIKDYIGNFIVNPDNFENLGWQIKAINKINMSGQKLIVYTVQNKQMDIGVQVNEDTLRMFFSPWCEWTKRADYLYKTNCRHVFVKKEFDNKIFKAHSSCHAADDFDLEVGLEIASRRLEAKIKAYRDKRNVSVGDRFGDLEVIAYMGKDKSRHHLWKCRCKCGKVFVIRSTTLRNGTRTSCGKCKEVASSSKNIHPIWGNTSVSEQENLKKQIEHICQNDIKSSDNKSDFVWQNNNFVLEEVVGELLEAPCYNYIVHAVSADFKEKGAIGTTKKIIELFNIKNDLISEIDFLKSVSSYNKWLYNTSENIEGEVISYAKNVLSLIVKASRYDKVTYNTINTGLKKLREIVERNHITHIAMPRICCGRDNLEWEIVRNYIIDTFKDINYKLIIKVYHY